MLNELAKTIHEGNVANGFYDEADNPYFVSHQLLEIIKEVAEASEAHKNNQFVSFGLYEKAATDSQVNMWQSKEQAETGAYKTYIKDKFETELADTLIRVLDLVGFLKVDMDGLIQMVLKENAKRGKLHGKQY